MTWRWRGCNGLFIGENDSEAGVVYKQGFGIGERLSWVLMLAIIDAGNGEMAGLNTGEVLATEMAIGP
jgi:hypothetical protein